MKVLLVNPNLVKPPIAPLGLDLLADALDGAGFSPELLDLSFADDPHETMRQLDPEQYLFAAVSLRNIDDSMFPGTDELLKSHKCLIATLQESKLPIAIGGVGFSAAAAEAADYLGADFAIAGDGEQAIVALARALAQGKRPADLPGLVSNGAPARSELAGLPAASRKWVDNKAYFEKAGQIGFETKRGCTNNCAACPEPLIKGRKVRLRDPAAVAEELQNLYGQGVDVFHTCDCEFNVPTDHAAAVCRAIISAGLTDKIRWYAYCTPAGFDNELASLMRRAGCVGVDFSADHGDEVMLKRLRCPHGVEDLEQAARACREQGLRFMYDLLLASPGETRASAQKAIELMRRLSPTRIGVGTGVRLYPGCRITEEVKVSRDNRSLHFATDSDSLLWPVYYYESELGADAAAWLGETIGDDRRFFYGGSEHNYNEHGDLIDLLERGERGAFWDILARAAGD
jgi:radical SAM superfamily enzyme YgiQ (UPF0313 family)